MPAPQTVGQNIKQTAAVLENVSVNENKTVREGESQNKNEKRESNAGHTGSISFGDTSKHVIVVENKMLHETKQVVAEEIVPEYAVKLECARYDDVAVEGTVQVFCQDFFQSKSHSIQKVRNVKNDEEVENNNVNDQGVKDVIDSKADGQKNETVLKRESEKKNEKRITRNPSSCDGQVCFALRNKIGLY